MNFDELKLRTNQANNLLEHASANPTRAGNCGQMASYAKFLNSEIEKLSQEVALPMAKMTNAQFQKALDSEFKQVSGNHPAIYRSSYLRNLEVLLDNEHDETRSTLIANKIAEINAWVADYERMNELLKSDLTPEQLERHGIVVVSDDRDSLSPSSSSNSKRSYRSLFGAPKGASEFKGLSDMCSHILSGRSDPRLTKLACRSAYGASTLVGEDGGFAVPEPLVLELFNSALEQSIAMSRASVVSLINGSRLVASFDESDRENGSIYGFSSEWVTEGESMALTKPSFKTFKLSAKKLAIFTAITNELLHDAMQSGSAIEQALSKALAFSLDRALLVSGTGTSQPLSILNSASKIVQTKESGQSAGTIVYRNLSNMVSKLAPEFEKSAIWLASPSCKPSLMETSIETIADVAASHIPVLTQSGNTHYLLGKEILFSEHLPSVGTQGDIMLCDLSAYSVGIAKEISIDRSDHIYFRSDETAFRSIVRCDAAAKLASTITASNGATLSWCVTLETR